MFNSFKLKKNELLFLIVKNEHKNEQKKCK